MPPNDPNLGEATSHPDKNLPSEVAVDASLPLPSHAGDVPSPKVWNVGTLTYTSGGLIALFILLLMGDFAWSMRDRSVGPMSQWYLNQLKVPSVLYGLLMTSFPSLIGLFLSPIISYKSDRHRGKWGRRIPFLLVTTPLAAAGMIGLAVTPYVSSWVHSHFPNESEMMVSVICFGIFWASFEFATIASQSVFGGLINDVVPPQLIGRFYGLFRAVSLIDGIIFNYWIMGKVPDHFTLILIVIGTFYGCAFMWVCFKVKEGEYPPPPPEDPAKPNIVVSFFGGAKIYFRECFSNPYYVTIFVMSMCAALTFFPVNTFSIPFATSLNVSMDAYGKSLALTFGISLSISFFLGWLCDAFHPLRMCILCLMGYLLVTIYGSIYVVDADSFLVSWVLHGVLSGCYFTCSASLGQRLYPRSKFAQFGSAAGIVGSLASMVFGPGLGKILDLTNHVYSYTFIAGGIVSAMALIAAFIVYVQFMRLGGPKNYVAPE